MGRWKPNRQARPKARRERVQVPQGMLEDIDRQRLLMSHVERVPVVVATLHACVSPDVRTDWECVEPYIAMGVVATYNDERFTVAGLDATVRVPWLSAVKVWVKDMEPAEDEIKTLIRYYHDISVPRAHVA